jgi:hypothetical protein
MSRCSLVATWEPRPLAHAFLCGIIFQMAAPFKGLHGASCRVPEDDSSTLEPLTLPQHDHAGQSGGPGGAEAGAED